MADTEANQAEYPQHSNQALGCGFPLSKLVVMFSLLTGAVIAVMVKPWRCSEAEMARQMYDRLEALDVALADRLYGTYVDLAMVQSKGADAVFRIHQNRNTDFCKGKRLGRADHIVTWHKPKCYPKHMSKSEFAQLPDAVTAREVRYQISTPGFRNTLPIRPDRFEPRVVKRRPKPFPRMNKPRSSLKSKLVA